MGDKRVGYVILRISMVAIAVGGKTSGKPRLNMPMKWTTKGAAAPLVVYEIDMFSLGLPEVLPPTVIATMDIRNRT